MEKKRSGIKIWCCKEIIGGLKMKVVAELNVSKLEDRKTITAILHENGYTVGPGKRKKAETGKTIGYFLKVYVDEDIDE